MDMTFEVVVLPVSDVGRALDFYNMLGRRCNGWVVQEITTRLPGR